MEYFVDLLADMVRALTPMRVRKWIVKQKNCCVYSIFYTCVYHCTFSFGLRCVLDTALMYFSVLFLSLLDNLRKVDYTVWLKECFLVEPFLIM